MRPQSDNAAISRSALISIEITLDTYSHLFHDAEFVKQQVELLEGSFRQPDRRLENG
jgi:hypothetical protein